MCLQLLAEVERQVALVTELQQRLGDCQEHTQHIKVRPGAQPAHQGEATSASFLTYEYKHVSYEYEQALG